MTCRNTECHSFLSSACIIEYEGRPVLHRPPPPKGEEGQRHGGAAGEADGRFPWTQYRRVCLGVLRMPPSEFWGTDTWTVMDAYEGYAQSKGVAAAGGEKLNKDDVEELNRMMEAEDKRMRVMEARRTDDAPAAPLIWS